MTGDLWKIFDGQGRLLDDRIVADNDQAAMENYNDQVNADTLSVLRVGEPISAEKREVGEV